MELNKKTQAESHKLFVGQIPRGMRHDQLVAQFALFGEVEEVFIIKDPTTGLSKGCCFVRFLHRSSAERCIELLHDKVMFQGATNLLKISFATAAHHHNHQQQPQSHGREEVVFVLDQLPPTFQPEHIEPLFDKSMVTVKTIVLSSPGIFHVCLEMHPSKVPFLVQTLNGQNIQGHPIRVVVVPPPPPPTTSHHSSSSISPRSKKPPTSSVPTSVAATPPIPPAVVAATAAAAIKLFVGGLLPHTTESDLFQIFSFYGKVVEVVVLRFPNGVSKISGFVKYETEEEAFAAVSNLGNSYSLPGSNRPLTVRHATYAPPNNKLFVGHLPGSFDEERTHAVFQEFGMVLEVHVMRDARTGMSKGCAFVKYQNRESAEAAMQALNGSTQFGEIPLKVSCAISRRGKLNPHFVQPPRMVSQEGGVPPSHYQAYYPPHSFFSGVPFAEAKPQSEH